MYDLKKSHFSLSLQRSVATGSTVDREGVLLQAVLESGNEVVKKAEASASLKLVGFAISDNEDVGVIPYYEELVVPAAPGPYVVETHWSDYVGTAPTVQMLVVQSGGSALTQVAAAPADGEFQPDTPDAGKITFNAAQAGATMLITYRANLTVAQSRQLYYQRFVNNTAGAEFNTVVVAGGVGEIWTSEYDATVDWANASAIHSGADGILTSSGGTEVPNSRVIHVPDADNAMLGIAFAFPN